MSRPVWKQSVIKGSRLVSSQGFISEHSSLKFNPFPNWKLKEIY